MTRHPRPHRLALAMLALSLATAPPTTAQGRTPDRPPPSATPPWAAPPAGAGVDYQIGGDYPLPEGVAVVEPMVATCAAKGFEAVEFDNLDSWTRFDGTPMEDELPFGEADAIAFAELLADMAHAHGLAAAQKNTVELPAEVARARIGFDFAVAEECGHWDECQGYVDVYGDHVIAIEYDEADFRRTCRGFGDRLSVVLRDIAVSTPGSDTYRYARCPG